MRFAKFTFRLAGIYGILVTVPLYFSEQKMGLDYPPPITHPEYYYSFAGVTLAFQILFLFIASNPPRYRPLMIPCMVEKLSLVPTLLVLYPRGLFPSLWVPLAAIDLILGALFLAAYLKTRDG